MDTGSGYLGASEHGGVAGTLTSSDPSILLLSPNDGTAGASSVTVDVSKRVHGLQLPRPRRGRDRRHGHGDQH